MTTTSSVESSGPALVGNNAPQGHVLVGFGWSGELVNPVFTLSHKVPAKPVAIRVFKQGSGCEVSIPGTPVEGRIGVTSTADDDGGTVVFTAFIDEGAVESGDYIAEILFAPDLTSQVGLNCTFTGGTIISTGTTLRPGNDLRGEIWGTVTGVSASIRTITPTPSLGARPFSVELFNADGAKLRTSGAAAAAGTIVPVATTDDTVVFGFATGDTATYTFCIQYEPSTEEQAVLAGIEVAPTTPSVVTTVSSGPALQTADPGLVVLRVQWVTPDTTITIKHHLLADPVAVQVFQYATNRGQEIATGPVAGSAVVGVTSVNGETDGPDGGPGGTITLAVNVTDQFYNVCIRFAPDTVKQAILQDATLAFSAP